MFLFHTEFVFTVFVLCRNVSSFSVWLRCLWICRPIKQSISFVPLRLIICTHELMKHTTESSEAQIKHQCDYNHNNNDNKDKANNNIISLLKYFPVKTQRNIYNWHKTSCWTLTCKNRTHTSCCHTHSVDPSASENSPQHYFLFVWFDETTQTMFFSF